MVNPLWIKKRALLVIVLLSLAVACAPPFEEEETTLTLAPRPSPPTSSPPAEIGAFDEWALWIDGPHLRGANVYQRRIYPELDGAEFAGPVGPPYTQKDFDRLAAMGANVVNISHPGLFGEEPPYALDPAIEAHLDGLLDMIARADMFAGLAFRTGPGRSEFTFFYGDDDDWFDESYYNDSVWEDAEAQAAWAEMWRYTAGRYRDHPIVVGYDLMVEPNANEVGPDVWDPEVFYDEYGDTLYNWNQLYPRITAAIREVDPETPILVEGLGYSELTWLPYLEPTGDPRTIYTFHQYEPFAYTHQGEEPEYSYPDHLDTDWDGEAEAFDRAWLVAHLATAEEFSEEHSVPVAVNEFGVVRWADEAAAFVDDQMALFEALGFNHTLWMWETSWPPYAEEVDAFNFRHGPDPDHHADVETSALIEVIARYWGRNDLRPSTFAAPAREEESGAIPRLEEVTHWLYLIDVNLEQEMVETIAASEYDMVVLDFIPSEENNTDYPMAQVVASMHTAPYPKLVLAYIDMGEAEEYRTYWQPGWRGRSGVDRRGGSRRLGRQLPGGLLEQCVARYLVG